MTIAPRAMISLHVSYFLKTSQVIPLVQKTLLKDTLVRDRSGDNPAPILAGILTWSRGGWSQRGSALEPTAMATTSP